MKNKIISSSIFGGAILTTLLGCSNGIEWIVYFGLFLLTVGMVYMIYSFYEPGDTRPRFWGEHVFDAAARQISSGRTGVGMMFGIILFITAFGFLISGAFPASGFFLILGLAAVTS